MKFGIATIGTSPRDDVVPHLRQHLPTDVEIIEVGALDGLAASEIAELDDEAAALRLVTRGPNGTSPVLSHAKLMPIMQTLVTQLVDQGCGLVLVLCGADWTGLSASVPIINPGQLFPNVIKSVAKGLRLGIIKPDAGQVELTIEQYSAMGLEPIVTSASPYANDRIELARIAAELLKAEEVDMVWMTCVGMNEAMRDEVNRIVGKPCILAQSLLGKIVGEMLR